MPKSKLRKNHKQKVAARNERLNHEKRRRDKFQREFIMNLIKQEQEKGMFENNTSVDGPVMDGPVMDGLMMDGPVMDSLMMDGPVMDTPIMDAVVIDGPTLETEAIESPVTEETTENTKD